jgi:hypothetical protein
MRILRERKRAEDKQEDNRIVYDSVMSTYEHAYQALFGSRPHVKELRGFFYVQGKGRFTRAQLLKQAAELDAQLHAQILQGDCNEGEESIDPNK